MRRLVAARTKPPLVTGAKVSLIAAIWLWALMPRDAGAQEFRLRLPAEPVPRSARTGPGRTSPAPQTVTVDLDGYVEGVLAGEASVLKNRAALQSMAVLARTWALRHRGRHRAEGYDFCSLTHCQVFRLPPGSQYPAAIRDAVISTRNQVLRYRGRLADPYFTADCGGVSESAGDVWPGLSLPYLASSPDPYCAASPHSSWQRTIPLDRVAEVLRDQLHLPIRGPVSSLKVVSRDGSGRARTIAVVAGARFDVDANRFRYAVGRTLGWDTLKSNLYTVELGGEALEFKGRGLGHGVGLCQAGADAMAGLGVGYRQILAHYFPGTSVSEWAAARPTPEADPTASSEHFELAYPEAQRRWVSSALDQLENWRSVLEEQAPAQPDRVRVKTYGTTAEFTRATGEPGWVAGSTDGKSIFLQPLATLAAKGILNSTLRHELTHLTLHRLRARGAPEWFEEGFVLYLTGEVIHGGAEQSHVSAGQAGATLGEALARPRSEQEMHAAYARSLRLVHALAEKRGPEALWQVLGHPTASDLAWLKSEESGPAEP